ncbi:MAG: ImmA/IrrE family metallo-endopeptidase [Clostridiales bacterium]|nr:ImmA/IrrE family metallo-endopeptidase [Clostridiales bacterium]
MNIEQFKQIIQYNKANQQEIGIKVHDFFVSVGMDPEKELLNIMQIARPLFRGEGYLVAELPLSDREIGALCYKGDALGYIILNSSLPKVNVNFAICHELYHVFCQNAESVQKVELLNEHYYEHGEESAANLFAGMLLMPEKSFRLMYAKFSGEAAFPAEALSVIVQLMCYFKAPYMAVLIRCYELGLMGDSISETLLKMDSDTIRNKFTELWLDVEILEASGRDDFIQLENTVKKYGEEYIEEQYINQHTLETVLKNMRHLYTQIKGE